MQDVRDDSFCVSTWLDYRAQLFGQILVQMLPQRYFKDVINIYNQESLSKQIVLHNVVESHQSVEDLKSKD